jgi:TorA maturation chaperone TorD
MTNEYMRLRSSLYRLLARPWYLESTERYLEDLKRHIPVFKSFGEYSEDLEEAFALLAKALENIDSDLIDRHERAFARIFLNTGYAVKAKHVAPVESVYLSASGLMMQEEWEQVLESYYEQNVHAPKFTEPADHISAEMHFLALRIDAEKQRSFLENHLLKWVDRVTQDLYEVSDETSCADYFRAVALLTAWFVHTDYEILCAVSEPESGILNTALRRSG